MPALDVANQPGATGPIGPTGPPGPAGAQGPAGPGQPPVPPTWLWVRSDTGLLSAAGVVAAQGASVTTWQDQSGLGHDLTVNTAGGGVSPVLRGSKVNGLPAVDFSGSTKASMLNAANPNSDYTIFAVFTILSNSPSQQYVVETPNQAFMGLRSGTYCFYDFQLIINGAALVTSAWEVMTISRQGGINTDFSWLDTTLQGQTNTGTSNGNMTGVNLGDISGSFGLDGMIAEVIVYNTGLSGADITSMQNYLKTKYGL